MQSGDDLVSGVLQLRRIKWVSRRWKLTVNGTTLPTPSVIRLAIAIHDVKLPELLAVVWAHFENQASREPKMASNVRKPVWQRSWPV
jgi:hypothetical protein